jgi:hypothetical protein
MAVLYPPENSIDRDRGLNAQYAFLGQSLRTRRGYTLNGPVNGSRSGFLIDKKYVDRQNIYIVDKEIE